MENLRVVLVASRNPLNIGAAARAMSNFGALHLRVVTPYEKAYREARSAVGAAAVLKEAEEFDSVAEAIADCTLVVGTTAIGNREIKQPLRRLEDAAPLIQKRMAAGRVAILFGSEKWGLSNESLSHCHWLMHIPTREEHYSMNLGQAVAVCLWELRRETVESSKVKVESTVKPKTHTQNRRVGHPAEQTDGGESHTEGTEIGTRNSQRKELKAAAKIETVEMITEVMLDVLRKSGYVAPRGQALAEEKLRRMLRRFELEAGDAEVFLGMMRKIAWKVGQGGEE
jgi:tRNA/rRNA methyltransferase